MELPSGSDQVFHEIDSSIEFTDAAEGLPDYYIDSDNMQLEFLNNNPVYYTITAGPTATVKVIGFIEADMAIVVEDKNRTKYVGPFHALKKAPQAGGTRKSRKSRKSRKARKSRKTRRLRK